MSDKDKAPERDGRLIALCNNHSHLESPAYKFGCSVLGAAERAGFVPNGMTQPERDKQRKQLIGAVIEQFVAALERPAERGEGENECINRKYPRRAHQ